MDEAAARAWLHDILDVSRETFDRLEAYVGLLLAESERQNLIARSTVEQIWARHIVDSAQLLPLADGAEGRWLDIGTGPGLPGIVLAILGRNVTLVESRARRIAFLSEAVTKLGLANRCSIVGKRLEAMTPSPHALITARAFAPMTKTFELARPSANRTTLWILPRGKSVEEELAAARESWQFESRTVQSVTHPDAKIVVARNVRRRR